MEVEPRVKMPEPVLLTYAPWALKVMMQDDPERPAVNVPEFVTNDW